MAWDGLFRVAFVRGSFQYRWLGLHAAGGLCREVYVSFVYGLEQ